MKNRLLLLFIVVLILMFSGYVISRRSNSQKLLSPGSEILKSKEVQLSPTSTPTPTPVKFNFGKTTDLKEELDSINPKVQDSDFDSLKQIILSL